VPVIAAHEVVKTWGTTLVHAGLTFEVGPGVTGLLGPNGSGKTTLIGMLLGLHRPDRGRLEVLGLDPHRSGPALRARIGYAPEHHRLPPDVRAQDLVRHIAALHGLPLREATTRASDILWTVGLGEERHRPIGTMSTGQRQRVKLAQAIAHDPRLVLLDEPTDGLDPVQREVMLGLIRRCSTDFGMDVLVSSHHLEEVERTCDAAVILSGGRVVASGPLTELRGATTGTLIEVDERGEELAAALAARGLTVSPEGRRLLVRADLHPDDLADRIRDALVDSGAPVRRVQPRSASLEEVFLDVAGYEP
jgi:ABC-2 type transport system ATP-binding protein